MTTKKLYDADAYLTAFDATVLSCDESKNGYAVVLDATVFFPEEGGQKPDRGTLGGICVTDVQIKNGMITHFLPSPLPVGQTVHGEIDFSFRYRNMQNHSGEHIVSGLIHTLYGLENVGFHLGTDDMTIDLSGELSRADLDRIETFANEVIYRNVEIIAEYPSAEVLRGLSYRSKLDLTENVRIVTIPGVDVCACCAPHVRRTGEIGSIKLLDFIRYKGGVRIHMHCGSDALADYREKYTELARAAALLSVKQNEVAEAVDRTLREGESLRGEMRALKAKLARADAASLSASGALLTVFSPETDMLYLRELALACAEKATVAAVLSGNEKDGYSYILCSHATDLRPCVKQLNAALSGRGGGNTEMVQGSFRAPAPEIRKTLADTFAET